MKKALSAILALLTTLLFIGCSASQPAAGSGDTAEIEAIRKTIAQFVGHWQNKEGEACMALWAEDGRVMYGFDREIVPPAEYVKIIDQRMAVLPAYDNTADADIELESDTAAVVETDIFDSFITVEMVKRDGKWLFKAWSY